MFPERAKERGLSRRSFSPSIRRRSPARTGRPSCGSAGGRAQEGCDQAAGRRDRSLAAESPPSPWRGRQSATTACSALRNPEENFGGKTEKRIHPCRCRAGRTAQEDTMALYAIGDLAPGLSGKAQERGAARTGALWVGREEKMRKNCAKCMTPEDTWSFWGITAKGRNLEEAAPDLAYIEALPGRKILLRGNHDMFWDAKKTEKLKPAVRGKALLFCRITSIPTGTTALVGTKGFAFEGPFYVNGARGDHGLGRGGKRPMRTSWIAREAQRPPGLL